MRAMLLDDVHLEFFFWLLELDEDVFEFFI